MISSYKVHSSDIEIIRSPVPIAQFGTLPVNAFVLKGSEPVLVDTGIIAERDEFIRVLRTVIDPADLKWIWLSHAHPDHVGGLHKLLNDYPQIRLITTFHCAALTMFYAPIPWERVAIVNNRESIQVGDRTLTAIKPPLFDNPETLGFFDSKTQALFTSDCFGAVLPKEIENAAEVSEKALADGQILWGTIDFQWVHKVDVKMLERELDAINKMQPKMILSSHLAPAGNGLIKRMINTMYSLPKCVPFHDPDVKEVEQILAQMMGG